MSSFAFNEYASDYAKHQEFLRRQQSAREEVEGARWRTPRVNRDKLKKTCQAVRQGARQGALLTLFASGIAMGSGAIHVAQAENYAFDPPHADIPTLINANRHKVEASQASQQLEQEHVQLPGAPEPIHDASYDYVNDEGKYVYVANGDELGLKFQVTPEYAVIDVSQIKNPQFKEAIKNGKAFLAEFETIQDLKDHQADLYPLPNSDGMNFVFKDENGDLYTRIATGNAATFAVVFENDETGQSGANTHQIEYEQVASTNLNPDATASTEDGQAASKPQIPPTQTGTEALSPENSTAHPNMGPGIGGEQSVGKTESAAQRPIIPATQTKENASSPIIPATQTARGQSAEHPQIPPTQTVATATPRLASTPIIPRTEARTAATPGPATPEASPAASPEATPETSSTPEAATATSQTPIPVVIPTTRPTETATAGTPAATPHLPTPEATPGVAAVLASAKATPSPESTPVVGPASHEHGSGFHISHETKKIAGETLAGILAAGVAAYWLRRKKVFEKYGIAKDSAQVKMAHALQVWRDRRASTPGEITPPPFESPLRTSGLGGHPRQSEDVYTPPPSPWDALGDDSDTTPPNPFGRSRWNVPPAPGPEDPNRWAWLAGEPESVGEEAPAGGEMIDATSPTESRETPGASTGDEFAAPPVEAPATERAPEFTAEATVTPEALAMLEAMPNKSASAEQFLAENKDLLIHQVQVGDFTYFFTEVANVPSARTMALVYDNSSDNPQLKSRFWQFSNSDHQWKALPGLTGNGHHVMKGIPSNPDNHYVQSGKLHPDMYDALKRIPNARMSATLSGKIGRYIPISSEAFAEPKFGDEIEFSEKQVEFHDPEWENYQWAVKKLMDWYTELISNNSFEYQDFRPDSNKYKTIEEITGLGDEQGIPEFSKMRDLLRDIDAIQQKVTNLRNNHQSEQADQLAYHLEALDVQAPRHNNPDIQKLVDDYNAAVGPFIEFASHMQTPDSMMPAFAPENVVATYEKPQYPGADTGKITVEEFEVVSPDGQNRLRIAMARDTDGRTYIDNIYDPNVGMDEYGTPKLKTNMGLLVYKPDDYTIQTFGLPKRYIEPAPNDPDGTRYSNIAKFWEENFDIVKAYKKYKDGQLAGKTATEPAETPSATSVPTSTRAPRLVEGVIRDGKLIRKSEDEAIHDEAAHDNDEQPEAEAGSVAAPTAEPAARPAPTLVEGAIGSDGKLTTKTKLEEEKRRAEAESAHTRAMEPTEEPDRTDSTESGRLIPSGVGAYWTLARELARQRYLAERARRTADRQGNDAEGEPTTAEPTLPAPEASSASPAEAAPAGPRKLTEGFRLPNGRIITGQKLQDYRRQEALDRQRQHLEAIARSAPLGLAPTSGYRATEEKDSIPATPASTDAPASERPAGSAPYNILPRGEKPLITPAPTPEPAPASSRRLTEGFRTPDGRILSGKSLEDYRLKEAQDKERQSADTEPVKAASEPRMSPSWRSPEVRQLSREEIDRLGNLSQEDTIPLNQIERQYGYLAQTAEAQILQDDWQNMKPATRFLLLTSLAEHALPYGPTMPKKMQREREREARMAALEPLFERQRQEAFANLKLDKRLYTRIQKNQQTAIELGIKKDKFAEVSQTFINGNLARRIEDYPAAIKEDLRQYVREDRQALNDKWPDLTEEERKEILTSMITGKFVDDSIRKHRPELQDNTPQNNDEKAEPPTTTDPDNRPDDDDTEPNDSTEALEDTSQPGEIESEAILELSELEQLDDQDIRILAHSIQDEHAELSPYLGQMTAELRNIRADWKNYRTSATRQEVLHDFCVRWNSFNQ